MEILIYIIHIVRYTYTYNGVSIFLLTTLRTPFRKPFPRTLLRKRLLFCGGKQCPPHRSSPHPSGLPAPEVSAKTSEQLYEHFYEHHQGVIIFIFSDSVFSYIFVYTFVYIYMYVYLFI